MKRNFIHLPFNMLFYLILKNSKNGVLYGLNKEHVNFIAHHETKFSHGVAQAGSDHCQVTVRVRAATPGTLAGSRAGAPHSAHGWVPAVLCLSPASRFPHSICKFIFCLSEGKSRDDFLSATSHFLSRQIRVLNRLWALIIMFKMIPEKKSVSCKWSRVAENMNWGVLVGAPTSCWSSLSSPSCYWKVNARRPRIKLLHQVVAMILTWCLSLTDTPAGGLWPVFLSVLTCQRASNSPPLGEEQKQLLEPGCLKGTEPQVAGGLGTSRSVCGPVGYCGEAHMATSTQEQGHWPGDTSHLAQPLKLLCP